MMVKCLKCANSYIDPVWDEALCKLESHICLAFGGLEYYGKKTDGKSGIFTPCEEFVPKEAEWGKER